MKLTYTQIKNIKTFCEGLLSEPNWREVVENIVSYEEDFKVDNVRFIHSDDIDEIQQEELKSDLYVLGCFNAWFLAGVLDIDSDVIEAMQEAEAFEAIGKLIVSMDKVDELQEKYASVDGYGHHFNHYDGNEDELTIDSNNYFVFDNH